MKALTDKDYIDILKRRDNEKITFEKIAKQLGVPVSQVNNGIRKHTVLDVYLGNPDTPLSGAGGFYPDKAIGMRSSYRRRD